MMPSLDLVSKRGLPGSGLLLGFAHTGKFQSTATSVQRLIAFQIFFLIPHFLYPHICWLKLTLILLLGYCDICHSEHVHGIQISHQRTHFIIVFYFVPSVGLLGSKMAVLIHTPTKDLQRFPFPHIFAGALQTYSKIGNTISQCGFNLYFFW